jgi:hypothetical protein
VAYTVKELSRVEKIMSTGLEVTRVLDVAPYAARGEAYNDLLGGVRLIGGRLVRFPPLADPAFPWCRVSDITTEPIDDTDYLVAPSPSYNPLRVAAPYKNAARMTVVYRTPEGGQDENDIDNGEGDGTNEAQEIDLADESWEFSNSQVQIPNTTMAWERTDGGTSASPLPPGSVLNPNSALAARMLIPKLDYTLVRKLVVRKPTQAILLNLGRVNKKRIRLGPDTYEAECVRFDGASARRAITNRGVKFYEVTYKFCVNPIFDSYWKGPGADTNARGYVGWNRFYRFDQDRYMYVSNPKNANRRVYQYDEDDAVQVLGGRTVKGFLLLFNPYAK